MLRGIPADFSPAIADAIRQVPYMDVGKIGLPFRRRFWEEDDRIYGGISWTDQNITQIFYPNTDYLGTRGGVLVGYYHFGPDAAQVGKLAPAGARGARAGAGRAHPPAVPGGVRGRGVFRGVAAHPYNLGGWASWSEEARARIYPVLNEPDGPFYLAGEHLTYLGGWMAGAFESAKAVVAALHETDRAGLKAVDPNAHYTSPVYEN